MSIRVRKQTRVWEEGCHHCQPLLLPLWPSRRLSRRFNYRSKAAVRSWQTASTPYLWFPFTFSDPLLFALFKKPVSLPDCLFAESRARGHGSGGFGDAFFKQSRVFDSPLPPRIARLYCKFWAFETTLPSCTYEQVFSSTPRGDSMFLEPCCCLFGFGLLSSDSFANAFGSRRRGRQSARSGRNIIMIWLSRLWYSVCGDPSKSTGETETSLFPPSRGNVGIDVENVRWCTKTSWWCIWLNPKWAQNLLKPLATVSSSWCVNFYPAGIFVWTWTIHSQTPPVDVVLAFAPYRISACSCNFQSSPLVLLIELATSSSHGCCSCHPCCLSEPSVPYRWAVMFKFYWTAKDIPSI